MPVRPARVTIPRTKARRARAHICMCVFVRADTRKFSSRITNSDRLVGEQIRARFTLDSREFAREEGGEPRSCVHRAVKNRRERDAISESRVRFSMPRSDGWKNTSPVLLLCANFC